MYGGYSLEEKCIGTWINGKPLYQKTCFYQNVRFINSNNTTNKYHKYDITLEDGMEITDINNLSAKYNHPTDGNVHRFGRFVASSVFLDRSIITIYLQSLNSDSYILSDGATVDITFTINYTKSNE